jgi:hypothetical protein
MRRLVALRLWNEDDVGILSGTMLQSCRCFEVFGMLLTENDSRRHMLHVLVLKNAQEPHDENSDGTMG